MNKETTKKISALERKTVGKLNALELKIAETNKKLDEIRRIHKKIKSFEDKQKAVQKNLKTTQEDIKAVSRNTTNSVVSLNKQADTLNEAIPTLEKRAKSLNKQLESEEKSITTKMKFFNDSIEKNKDRQQEIVNFYDKLFKTIEADPNKENDESTLSVREKILEFEQKTRIEFKELKKEMEDEIRSLLPGAGAAGLSSAYVEAKATYGNIPYARAKEDKPHWWDVPHHRLKQNIPNIINYSLFLLPLIFLAYHFIWSAEGFLSGSKTESITLTAIFLRILTSTPFIVISVFGWSTIKLRRRLYEEYNHKQRVMQLYRSFKDELDEPSMEEHRKNLLAIMLKTVSDKPTLAMNQYDLGGENIFQRLLGIRKEKKNKEDGRNG